LRRSVKGKLVIGLAALAVAAFAGVAYAATQSSGPTTRQAFLNDVAKRLNVTPQQLTAALQGATQDQLQAEVQAGRLTQAQANALEQRLKKNGNAPLVPFGFFGPGGAGGPGGPGVPGGVPAPRLRAFPGPFGPGPKLGLGFGLAGGDGAAASYLGLTDAQLFQQLSSGKSLAQIATARGKSVSGLEQAMTTAVKSRLDKLVTNKLITSAQEQQILSSLQKRLDQLVNAKGFKRPMVRGFAGPGMPFRGKMQAPPNAAGPLPGPAAQLFAPAGPSA
jgi:AraC-like DNA-binding protein